MKPVIYLSLIPTLALTIYVMGNPFLSNVLGLAWDSGAVTTGPVTVPLVLSLGIGIAAAVVTVGLRHRHTGLPVPHHRCAFPGHMDLFHGTG